MLIAQITDCHVVENGELFNGRIDTAAMLADAVAHINAIAPRVDVVLATGDLVNDGRAEQYEVLTAILDQLEMPVVPIPGNHDDRLAMRSAFADVIPAADDDRPVCYVNDEHPLRLVALDTTVPGDHGGECDDQRMAWLDSVLGDEPDQPTLVLQHHPPFRTGIAWMDDVGLVGAELEADVISRHPQVEAIVCGHIHRAVQTRFAGTVASTWPSTGAQVVLALDGTRYGYVDEPAAVALHQWDADTGLVSHVSYVQPSPTWQPLWATEE